MTEQEFQRDFYSYPWGLRDMYFKLTRDYAFEQIYPVLLRYYSVGEVGLPINESKRTLRKNK